MTYKDGVETFDASEVADGVDGQPAYIKIKTRIKGKYSRVFTAIGQNAARLMAIDLDHMTDSDIDRAYQIAQEVNNDVDLLYEAYTAMIVEWNWLDTDTGEPLPITGETIRDELDQFQIAFIRGKISDILRYPVTEGNPKSGTGSRRGQKAGATTPQTG